MACDRSVIFSGYWNIVESGVILHNSNANPYLCVFLCQCTPQLLKRCPDTKGCGCHNKSGSHNIAGEKHAKHDNKYQ